MKNLINYYYGLILNEFKRVEDRFLFEIDNYKYEFLPFEGDLKIFQKIYTILINSNKYCHEVVVNKYNFILTFYENKPYILLKKNLYIDSRVMFDDLLDYDDATYEKKTLDWKNLWKEKIDYYEYQINQIGHKYKIVSESFSYYIGISETAINLLNFVNENDVKFYICHRRIKSEDNMDCVFNPLNIVIDSRVRDIGEFLKFSYICDCIDVNDSLKYLEKLNLDYNESMLLLARLMYPSYYFDLYDKIIQGQINEQKIVYYIKKNVCYETFLKQVYKFLRYKYNIPDIEWLQS